MATSRYKMGHLLLRVSGAEAACFRPPNASVVTPLTLLKDKRSHGEAQASFRSVIIPEPPSAVLSVRKFPFFEVSPSTTQSWVSYFAAGNINVGVDLRSAGCFLEHKRGLTEPSSLAYSRSQRAPGSLGLMETTAFAI
jgi:hypothetical protein